MNRSLLQAALFLASGFGFALPLEAQQLPENWQQLPVAEFANEVDKVFDEELKQPIGDFDEEAVMQHAAKLFADIDLATAATTEFPQALKLFRAGWRRLDETQMEAVRTALAARQDDWTDRPYEEMRSKVIVMEWIKMPFEQYSQEARNWAAAGGDPTTVWDEDLHYYALFTAADPKVTRSSFTVRWEGKLTAPQTGQYTFSISPINVNGQHRGYSVAQTMTVSVNSQQIISATPENWNAQAQPVQLTAGQSVPLQVDVTVNSPKLPEYALHTILAWEGPGISKTIVPYECLQLPASDDQGLRATYSWIENGEDVTTVKIDKAIDFAWTSGTLVVSTGGDQEAARLTAAWNKQISTEFLDSLQPEGGTVVMHPLMASAKDSAVALTSAQRKQFLEMLLTRPALLEPLDTGAAVGLYRAFRIGNEDLALDVFGQWALQNAGSECRIPHDVHRRGVDLVNRETYCKMAAAVAHELPEHADRLRDEFLELPDGSCCLPVAYTLGYSYLSRDKFSEWTDLLTEKLSQDTLTGDVRVNWLIATAFTREIRLGSSKPYTLVFGRPMDGRVYLDEAEFTAQDADLKVKVSKQIAARLAATGHFDEARAKLDEAVGFAPANRTSNIAKWRARIDQYEQALAQQRLDHTAAAREAFLNRLKARRDRAASTGNSAAVAHYDELIDENSPEP